MSVMYIRNEQTGEFEPVPSLVGPQGPPGANGGGAGTVTSVNKVAPDATGNVTLTAANVGALPSDGTAVNATQLNGNSADKFAQIDLEEPEDAGDILLTNADLLAGKSLAQIMLMMYPVGAIYTSTVATSPAALFGGTWERILGKFLFGADDNIAAGSKGGEAAVTLTVEQMPAHNHATYSYGGDDVNGNGWALKAINSLDESQSVWSQHNGANQPHNNMPPYFAVYMWKRTA